MTTVANAINRPRASAARGTMRAIAAAVSVIASIGLTSCASDPGGPALLSVPGDRYAQAFEAACEAARAEGLVPEVVDRRAGTIETAPRFGGSLVEPWTWGEGTTDDILGGTFGFERRRARTQEAQARRAAWSTAVQTQALTGGNQLPRTRSARFEFVAAGFRPSGLESGLQSTTPLVGPVLPGSERGVGSDIEAYAAGAQDGASDGSAERSVDAKGALEVRVAVSVERRFRPGYQGSAYTRALGSFWRDTTVPDDGSLPRDRSLWTPVARDERLERALLERMRVALEGANAAQDAQAMRGSTNR
jgi:hypothetical protein